MQYPIDFSGSWNFGSSNEDVASVSKLADIMIKNWGEEVSWILDKEAHPHEARLLTLDSSKANDKLNWRPIWNLDRALSETIQWYKAWNSNKDMQKFSIKQIEYYHQECLKNE